MRLLELEIHNVRGIRHLLVTPQGNNCVIWGPNGSGKSAVVDAIDFLLTGRVLRLTGQGTSGITLKTHGPHIDYKPKDAKVRAVIELPGIDEPVEISRCMGSPNKLDCDESKLDLLSPFLVMAQRGQHMLTRREILKFITSEASKRAAEIQELLNLTEVEEIRKSLVRVSNDFEKELRTATGVLKSAEAAVNATIQTRSFNQEAVLEEVNRNRRLLGGEELSSAHSGRIKSGLRPPASAVGEHNFNVSLFERDVENIRKLLLPDNRKRLGECDRQLRALISLIQGDQEMLRAVSLQQLTELGLALLDETGSCPLCDTLWPPGKLCDHLEGRISAAKIAREYRAKVKRLSEDLASSVNTAVASISKVYSACESVGLSQDKPALEEWLEELKSLSADLANAAERYPRPGQAGDRVPGLLAPDALDEILERITFGVKAKYPDASPEQTAWDTLTRLEVTLKGLEDAVEAHAQAQVRLDKAALLLKSFQEARDSVLEKLYAEIRDRFIGLYREIHGTDEGEFTAKLEHDEAKLNLEVEFFGRGMHPPHALHSEGHQDSMGLCLYLALAEHLTKGVVELIILDDVVMSVDADHRLEICRVLSSQFPTRQFFITTHDRTWASQLKYEGVVRPGDWLEFYNWQIESGPQVNCETDIWDRIEADLLRNDVTSAAAKLRRAAEEYLAMTCDALGGKVSFKLNGRWELGDFFPGARDQYKKLLRDGKRAASSWDDRLKVEQLGELESTAEQIFQRCTPGQGVINENVHFNSWANYSVPDFRPVVEAFRDLFGLFRCSRCCGALKVTRSGGRAESVRCNCTEHWGLVAKGQR